MAIIDQDLTKAIQGAPAANAGGPSLIQGVQPAAAAPQGYAEIANRVVTPNETVQGQLRGLISENSPFIEQARTNVKGEAVKRGLLNSAMAASAGEQAAYAAALPIAQADADKYSRAGDINVQSQNQFGTEVGLQSLRGAQETALQQLRGSQASQIAQIEANYRTLMQTSDSAAKTFAQTSENIRSILADPNIPAPQKQAHVDAQVNLLRSSLAIQGAISNLNLGALLTFQ